MTTQDKPYHDRAMTLEAIGRALGVTRERVRQIETRALAKLRAECERLGITAQDVLETWQRQSPGPKVRL